MFLLMHPRMKRISHTIRQESSYMKKILFCITVLCILFACTACQGADAPPLDTSGSDVIDSTVSDEGSPSNDSSDETVESPAHEHTAVTDEGYAATCTSTGLTDGSHCSVCGEVITPQVILAKAKHTAVTDNGYAPTCTATGLTDGSHCSVCGEILTAQSPIPATGHTPVVDVAVEATYTATGLTEGSHCSVCGETLIAQTVIPKMEPVKILFAGGTVTKEPTTIKTKHLELRIDANVYVPDNLVETLDILTDVMEKVSGMKFEGNPHYADGLLLVEVQKDNSTECEYGAAYAAADGAVISSGDLLDLSTLVHECTHTLQFRQSAWYYCQWAMEGITEYTVYKTKAYMQKHYPNRIDTISTTTQSILSMTITDYDELYSHSMEYWIDNILEGSANANYTIGFRLMWYLDQTYGNYTDWIYKLEEAYPKHVNAPYSDQLPKEKILEAFYITYGESVFDDFYAWLKQNEDLFKEPSLSDSRPDMRTVSQFNLIPSFYYHGPKYSPHIFDFNGAHYRDLYIGLDAGIKYLTEYKNKTIDKLVLEVNPGVTVRLFNAKGELMRSEEGDFGKYIDLTGVSIIHLVGEGLVTKFNITGYH